MEPERWLRVKELFHTSCAMEPRRRPEFLAEQCGVDAELRAEVESLLARHQSGENFLETPASAIAARWLFEDDSPAPERLGPWRIVRPVGYGGMARVFLAERDDGQFRKTVAIKILRAGVYGDEVRRRILRERQVLADLDHPNIVRLIDGGITADHRPYLVMDFVDGQPITAYVASRRLPPPARLRLFLDVCRAVEYAHEHSVIHRDLKPGNVLVTADGRPKLLDFGIAKLLEAGESSAGGATTTGSRWFTPEYACPEQVRGEPVAPSGDNYSLGLMLYEILLERKPFQIENLPPYEAARIVCESTPDLSDLAAGTRRIVARAIRKNPAERYASVAELAADIQQELKSPGWQWLTRRRTRRVIAALALSAGALVLAGLIAKGRPGRGSRPPRITSLRQDGICPGISPDGKIVAFVTRPPQPHGLLLRSIATGGETDVDDGESGDCTPKWSPDGTQLAFVRWTPSGERDLYVIPSRGGQARRLTTMKEFDINWTSNGEAVAGSDREVDSAPLAIYTCSVSTGFRRRITAPPDGILGDIRPAFSPNGRYLAFVRYTRAGQGDIWLQPADGGPPRRMTDDQCQVFGVDWTPDSREIVFVSNRAGVRMLWRMAPTAGGRNDPVLIPGTKYAAFPTISRPADGAPARLVYEVRVEDLNIWRWRFGPRGKAAAVLTSSRNESLPAFSPDARLLAFCSDRSGWPEIWTSGADGTNPSQLTFMRSLNLDSPQWSLDGRRIAFAAQTRGKRRVYIIEANGGTPRRLTTKDNEEGNPSWSRDGRFIYYRSDESGTPQIWELRADGTGDARRMTSGGAWEARESPYGKQLYFVRSPSVPGLWTVPLDGGEETRVLPTVEVGYWAIAARGLWYIDDYHAERIKTGGEPPLMLLPWGARRPERIGTVPNDWKGLVPGFSVQDDGGGIAWTRPDAVSSELMLVENFR